jgi:NADPH:quinone reductase-like Zn-dependent oxidoreductase
MLMKALQFDTTGSLDALALCDVPLPSIINNDVLIKIHASTS